MSTKAVIDGWLTLSMMLAFSACGADKSSSTNRQDAADQQAMSDETDTPSKPNTDDTTPENAPTAVTVDPEVDGTEHGSAPTAPTDTAPTDAESGMTASLNFFGDLSVTGVIPPEATGAATLMSSVQSLSDLAVASDGKDGVDFACRAEVSGNAGWSIDLSYTDGHGLTKIAARATVDGDAETYLSLVSPQTGGAVYVGSGCEVALGTVDADQNAVVVQFDCHGGGSAVLYDSLNCSPPPTECASTIEGTAIFYLRGCIP